jgi:hypothetical protein
VVRGQRDQHILQAHALVDEILAMVRIMLKRLVANPAS